MAQLITFSTNRFDISTEPPNRINPIGGYALLLWIREKLSGTGFTTTEPDTEDWGWYMDVEGHGSVYLVGASGMPEKPGHDVDWTIQLHKHRSLKDKITGRNTMAGDDPLVALLEGVIRSESEFRNISVETDA